MVTGLVICRYNISTRVATVTNHCLTSIKPPFIIWNPYLTLSKWPKISPLLIQKLFPSYNRSQRKNSLQWSFTGYTS